MYVCQGAKELVNVQFDFENRHGGFHFVEVARGAVDGLGHELEHQVEVDFVFLHRVSDRRRSDGVSSTLSPFE